MIQRFAVPQFAVLQLMNAKLAAKFCRKLLKQSSLANWIMIDEGLKWLKEHILHARSAFVESSLID